MKTWRLGGLLLVNVLLALTLQPKQAQAFACSGCWHQYCPDLGAQHGFLSEICEGNATYAGMMDNPHTGAIGGLCWESHSSCDLQ